MTHKSTSRMLRTYLSICLCVGVSFVCMCVTVSPGYTLNMNKWRWNIQPVWKESKSHISRQCVHVNYAGTQLVNDVSLCLRSWHFPTGCSGSDKMFYCERNCPVLSRTLTYLQTLTKDHGWVVTCWVDAYLSLCMCVNAEIFTLQGYMQLQTIK